MRGGCELRVDAGGRGAEGHQCLGELDNELLSSKDVKRPGSATGAPADEGSRIGENRPVRCGSSMLLKHPARRRHTGNRHGRASWTTTGIVEPFNHRSLGYCALWTAWAVRGHDQRRSQRGRRPGLRRVLVWRPILQRSTYWSFVVPHNRRVPGTDAEVVWLIVLLDRFCREEGIECRPMLLDIRPPSRPHPRGS